MFVIYFTNFRSEDARSIPWKRISGWATWSVGGLVLSIAFGDRMAQVLQQYQTAIPLKVMYLIAVISLVIGTAFTVGALILTFGLAWFFCRKAFGEMRLPGWTGMPKVYYRDALLISIGGVCAMAGLQSMIAWASAHFPTVHRFAALSFSQEFAAKWPAAVALGVGLSRSLFLAALLAALGGFFAAYLKPWSLRILFLLVGAATLVGDWGSATDFAQRYLFSLIFLTVLVLGTSCIVRLNLLGIFLIIFASALISAALPLLQQPNEAYHRSAYALFAGTAIALGWPLVKWLTGSSEARA